MNRPSFSGNINYISNRLPLMETPYIKLPLGSITAKGWLYQQLKLSADGLTGHLDEIWEDVGSNSGWLGGTGESWERGPYWCDGLVPLAYTLKDHGLIEKAQKWIEWTLKSQKADGYFGPVPNKKHRVTSAERDLKKVEYLKEDWWPRMVMLKILQSYCEATNDNRVINFMTNYFKYQQKHLPARPLGYWTHWGRNRGGENLASIYWLYNRTGNQFLLDLAKLVFRQTDDWTNGFMTGNLPSMHCVNVAMGIKQPAIYYQQTKDKIFLEVIEKGIDDLMKNHGQIQGIFSGDEMLHGTNPTQGIETCAVVEFMFSLETLLKITGKTNYADMLERVTYNALPASIKSDFTGRQYYQLANQILCNREYHNFITKHQETELTFGLETGFGCCTANYHQGWPKYVAHLWLATHDNGLAALLYAPCEVRAKVADNIEVKFDEQTNYPFDNNITITLHSPQDVEFPLHLRIPDWCDRATIFLNGKEYKKCQNGVIVEINRLWKDQDIIELHLPMKIQLSRQYENSVGIERGPLVYALKIGEEWKEIGGEEPYATWEIYPTDPWNYGLIIDSFEDSQSSFKVNQGSVPLQPWEINSAPIQLIAKGKKIPQWQKYGGITGPIPYSPIKSDEPVEQLTLIPYGCTKLRIAEFPVMDKID